MKKKVLYGLTVCVVVAGVWVCCIWGSHAVSVLALQDMRNSQHRIVIDPGHGGIDGGATSCTGKLESSFNLEIAMRLRDLCHLLGYQTRMTRTTDMSTYTHGETIAAQKLSDLKERVRIANASPNAILVSIHQNNFPDSRYSGAQVFYGTSDGSKLLAESLQSAFVTSLNPGSKRMAKEADGIYLMEHIQIPGILVECGFLSNPAEEAKLRTAEYQKKLCCVIAASVADFIERGYANT